MRKTAAVTLVAGFATAALVALPALAVPPANAPLPSFEIADITGQTHRAAELRGHPTFLAVVPSRNAGDSTRTWMQQAQAHFRGTRVHLVTVVALHLSGVIPTGFVQSRARESTPEDQWHHTWLDRSGAIQQTLGVSGGENVPYIFALDDNGTVRAVVHGAFSPSAAAPVFHALDGQ